MPRNTIASIPLNVLEDESVRVIEDEARCHLVFDATSWLPGHAPGGPKNREIVAYAFMLDRKAASELSHALDQFIKISTPPPAPPASDDSAEIPSPNEPPIA